MGLEKFSLTHVAGLVFGGLVQAAMRLRDHKCNISVLSSRPYLIAGVQVLRLWQSALFPFLHALWALGIRIVL